MAKGKFISYLRVSTDKQGRSGLGLLIRIASVGNLTRELITSPN
jgi:hypothetical protein